MELDNLKVHLIFLENDVALLSVISFFDSISTVIIQYYKYEIGNELHNFLILQSGLLFVLIIVLS